MILRKDQVWIEMVIGIRSRYAYLELYPVPSGCVTFYRESQIVGIGGSWMLDRWLCG